MDILIQQVFTTKSPSSTPATPEPEYAGAFAAAKQQLLATMEDTSMSMDISQDSDGAVACASVEQTTTSVACVQQKHAAESSAAARLRKRGAASPLQLQYGVYGAAKASAFFNENADYGVHTYGTGIIGEDAYFVSSDSIGIFDGVGGWKSNGIDPSEYSGTLAEECKRIVVENELNGADEDRRHPQAVLEQAYLNVERAQ
jgi:hypothetical protein